MPEQYTGHTPTAGASSAGLAAARPGYDPTKMTLEEWMTAQLEQNPDYRPPQGWDINEDGTVERVQPGFLMRHPWLIPLMGVAGGVGLQAAGVGAAAGAGSAGAASGTGATAAGTTGAGVGGMGGLAPAGYTVPGAELGAGGGIATGGSGVGGLLGRVGDVLKNGKVSDILSSAGDSIGAAANAAGNNRIVEAQVNTNGRAAYERELQDRAGTERTQRNDALDNVYRNSWYSNRQASPLNSRGLTPMSDEFKATLANLSTQGAGKLATGAQYDTNAMPALPEYQNTKQGTLEKAGGWLGGILGGVGRIGKILK